MYTYTKVVNGVRALEPLCPSGKSEKGWQVAEKKKENIYEGRQVRRRGHRQVARRLQGPLHRAAHPGSGLLLVVVVVVVVVLLACCYY